MTEHAFHNSFCFKDNEPSWLRTRRHALTKFPNFLFKKVLNSESANAMAFLSLAVFRFANASCCWARRLAASLRRCRRFSISSHFRCQGPKPLPSESIDSYRRSSQPSCQPSHCKPIANWFMSTFSTGCFGFPANCWIISPGPSKLPTHHFANVFHTLACIASISSKESSPEPSTSRESKMPLGSPEKFSPRMPRMNSCKLIF
mmetsp:Transcript_20915/g.36260  ORF Transcript_20915/g.36260 Transcript_20915/m.36260 type:complete len:203 (+) Transcript_20915:992-1600(+)